MAWLGGMVRRCGALLSVAATVVGIATFAVTEHLTWAWLAIGGLAVFATGAAWTANDEHDKRVALEAMQHQPPGGGLPLVAPVDYQVIALRQVIARISETTQDFGRAALDDVLQNLPRTGTDQIYEPLMAGTCQEGMLWLVDHGELADLGGSWVILGR